MPIDPTKVQWDVPDPKAVKWDDASPSPQDTLTAAGLTPAQHRQDLANTVGGLVRGAGSIGATILYPVDKLTDMLKGDRGPTLSGMVTGQQPQSRNEERRQAMTDALQQSIGADPNSLMFGGSKLLAETLGTAGVGGGLANALGRVPGLAAFAPGALSAIRSGGMTAGAAGPLTRVAGGAITGGASAGLVDPKAAEGGAVIGGLVPAGAQTLGYAGGLARDFLDDKARSLMQSALKPTVAQLKSGDAKTAVDTLLQYGISPNAKGVGKLNDLIDGLNTKVSSAIAGSNATVSKQNVLNALASERQKFGNQVSPTGDLNAIQGVADDFMAHPNLPGADIPVQAAQTLKQGTYNVLRGKYGEAGSAATEAQKGLARGLKDEIAAAVPGVGALNAEESRLLTTLGVTERRALMDLNKNPMGLATLAKSPLGWAAFMADKSPAFKALAARMLSSGASPAAATAGQNLLGGAANPLLRTSAVLAGSTS